MPIGSYSEKQLFPEEKLVLVPEGISDEIASCIMLKGITAEYLLHRVYPIKKGDKATLSQMIEKCCQCKADIVANDETEAGLRALLNLGHTFGHAIESEQGYGNWLHGEAVATGMVLAAKLAVAMNLLEVSELCRIESLIEEFDLPLTAPTTMGLDDFVRHMRRDKKNLGGKLRFIVPTAIGQSEIRDDVTVETLQQIL